MKKILIVENDISMAEKEEMCLEIGFDVTIETDGAEGEKKALSGDFDMLILAVELPGRKGFQICEKFREKYLQPVIFVSDKTEENDVIHGLRVGADDYVTKPFNPFELAARVKAHMNRYDALVGQRPADGEGTGDMIVVRDLKIDESSHRVNVRGQEVYFPRKEFNLLCFLAKNPDITFSTQELIKKLWGFSVKENSNTVRTTIRKIRSKIEENPADPQIIITDHGYHGYYFRDKRK